MSKNKLEQKPETKENDEGFPTQLILLLITIGVIIIAFALKSLGVF